jgi:hypothetical protein
MRISILLAFLLSIINAQAQESFVSMRGKLIDKQSKEPIPYASVYVKGKSIGTTSNDDGKFLFHIPTHFGKDTVIISVIGYHSFKQVISKLSEEESVIALRQNVTLLNAITIRASKDELTAKDIVRKAVTRIPENYPMQPFVIEGFFRDLQKEDDKPVALLEAALRFLYKDYNPGHEDVEIVEVRKSFNKRHPVNGTYDRQNSIFDLMEDNYVKHRFGPIKTKGWKFSIDSVLSYNNQNVYKISGVKSASESTELYIDSDDFSIIKLELKTQMVNGEFYRRYLNLPDPYGQQETSFKMIFEFQKIDGKMYLKYQREEDTYNLFNKFTNEILLRQSYVKELFVNNVIQNNLGSNGLQMNINKSVEEQAKPFNANFWKYYNAPVETSKFSEVIKQLENSELKTDK